MVQKFLECMTPICTPAELGRQLWTIGQLCKRHDDSGQVEIVWSGPETEFLSYRRTDQVLYDLINAAKKEILIVTFAASRIKLLNNALLNALNRGVTVRLVLEFEEESDGQLSRSAIDAFSSEIVDKAAVYYWPKEGRELNQAGRPGKLHAKCAVVDNNALIFSANLTDDAFNRNMELGALFRGGNTPGKILTHFDFLFKSGILARYE
jgi:cardiolipin synthase A/B